jgi:HD-like signal output (HDOD) protein
MKPTPARELIAQYVKVPTLPAIVTRLREVIEDPGQGTEDVARVIATDGPLAARVLRIANSPYYGLQERCLELPKATAVLGTEAILNIVLQATVLRDFDHLRALGFDLDGLWRHSVICAQTCRTIALGCRQTSGFVPEEAYTGGLLHDLGRVVMLDHYGAAYVELHASAPPGKVHLAERAAFGYDHAQLGAQILARWALPAPASQAVLHHHAPALAREHGQIVFVVACADQIAHAAVGTGDAAPLVFRSKPPPQLGLSPERVAELVAAARRSVETCEG